MLNAVFRIASNDHPPKCETQWKSMEDNTDARLPRDVRSLHDHRIDECRPIHHRVYAQGEGGQGQHRRLDGRLSNRLTCESFNENRKAAPKRSPPELRASGLIAGGNIKNQPENCD